MNTKVLKGLKRNKLLVAVMILYCTVLIVNSDVGFAALSNSIYYIKEMLIVMPVIFLLTIAIDVLVPRASIVKHFGEEAGFRGNVLALILGSISAGPIYAAFPICKMLIKKGARLSNIVIVLSAWAVVKLPMLANEVKFLGIRFMILRWVLTVISIFLIGWFTEKVLIAKSADVTFDLEG